MDQRAKGERIDRAFFARGKRQTCFHRGGETGARLTKDDARAADGAILGINFSKARPGGRNSLEAITIHETAHGASRVFQGYSEFQIASAAFTVGRAATGLVPNGVIPPGKNDDYNNLLFDQTVIAACGPYPDK